MTWNCNENAIEWLKGQKVATVSLSAPRLINRIRKLSTSHPDDVTIVAENTDGSLLARVPQSWVKINPPKQLSEEQRRANAERLANHRASLTSK